MSERGREQDEQREQRDTSLVLWLLSRLCLQTLILLSLDSFCLCLLHVAGVIFLTLHKALGSGNAGRAVGYILQLCAVSSKAVAAVLTQRFFSPPNTQEQKQAPIPCGLHLALGQTVAGAVVAVAATLCLDSTGATNDARVHFGTWVQPSTDAWLAVLYLGLGGSCVVYILQFFLIRRVGAVRQTTVGHDLD